MFVIITHYTKKFYQLGDKIVTNLKTFVEKMLFATENLFCAIIRSKNLYSKLAHLENGILDFFIIYFLLTSFL